MSYWLLLIAAAIIAGIAIAGLVHLWEQGECTCDPHLYPDAVDVNCPLHGLRRTSW